MDSTACLSSAPQKPASFEYEHGFTPISFISTITAGIIAGLGYTLGFAFPAGSLGVLMALPALCLLSRQRSAWRAFGIGLLVAFAMYVPSLAFFMKIFGPFAILLWFILSVPVGIFLLLLNFAHRRLGPIWALCLTPVLWTGLEYFRSEVWYLRFAWLLPGQAAATLAWRALEHTRRLRVGVCLHGSGSVTSGAQAMGPHGRCQWIDRCRGFDVFAGTHPMADDSSLHVAGVQTEEWKPQDVTKALDSLATAHPEAQLLVLSELRVFWPRAS